MTFNHDKMYKLSYVATQYYIKNKTQSEIAKALGVSRPMVSKMLSEARNLGVVKISVKEFGNREDFILERLHEMYDINGGVLVDDMESDSIINEELSKGTVELLENIGAKSIGVGWGHLIGELISWLEKNPRYNNVISEVFPLVGNASISARNYQSNENVRIMAQQLGARAYYLYLPALPESLEEKRILCSTTVYNQISDKWNSMDVAIVNIGNYPSSPDFASLVRYGNLLAENKTCGRLLVYYFNEEGKIIESNQDFAIQIPLDVLKKCPNIIGVCSATTSVKALRGAMNSKLFTHIVARKNLVEELLNI